MPRILDLNYRDQDNVVGTFIHHFMSKHSSEILKVKLKIQQSPKENWGSLFRKQDSISVCLSR